MKVIGANIAFIVVSVRNQTHHTIYLNCLYDTHLLFQFRQKEIWGENGGKQKVSTKTTFYLNSDLTR